MVKIRYSELPPGLHVSATRDGRRTVIYLLPGLTPLERRAALIRVRSGARMGLGPELPRLSMTLALGADRMRTTVRNGVAAMRVHPVLLLPPLILLTSGAVVLSSFVTLTVNQPQATGSAPAVTYGTPISRTGAGLAELHAHAGQNAVRRGGPAGRNHARSSRRAPVSRSASAARINSQIPDLPGSASRSPDGPATNSARTPRVTPSPSAGTCIKLGPFGVCVIL